MGYERKRCTAAGAFTALEQRAGNGARTGLAARRNGTAAGLLDRRSGAELRSQSDLGNAPPGAGGRIAGTSAATSARRPHHRADRHALPGAGGASERRTLPTHGASLQSISLDHAAGRRAIQRLAQRKKPSRARTHSRSTGAVSQNPTTTVAASAGDAFKRP